MKETKFIVHEGGDVRLKNQPRGYNVDIIRDGEKTTLFSYSILREKEKFVVYHIAGNKAPYKCFESENIAGALKAAFEVVNRNARSMSGGKNLSYILLKESEFQPQDLENVKYLD